MFEPKEKTPNKKHLMLTREEGKAFSVRLKYTNPEQLSKATDVDIGVFDHPEEGLAPLSKYNTTDKPRVAVTVEIDRNGMARVTSTDASVSEYVEKQVRIGRKKKKKDGEQKKDKDDEKAEETDEEKGDEKAEGKEEDKEEEAAGDDDSASDEAKLDEDGEDPEVILLNNCSWNATVNVTLGEPGEDDEPKEVGAYVEIASGGTKTKDCSYVNASFEGEIVLKCEEGTLDADTADCSLIQYESRTEKVFRHVDVASTYTQQGITGLTKEQMGGARKKLKAIHKKMEALRNLAKVRPPPW